MNVSADSKKLLPEDFAVERELGCGGMGQVYLVQNSTTSERYALKVTQFADANGQEQFLRELQTMIALPDHPHLLRFRFFRSLGPDWIGLFTDYLSGGSLADRLHEGTLVQLDQVLEIAIQSAWGLDALHDRRILHGDFKPANVLFDATGAVKLSDFGLATAVAQNSAIMFIGHSGNRYRPGPAQISVQYVSPEQADRSTDSLTPLSDIWSWGVSLLEMFTGEATWLSGTVALEALEAYLEAGAAEPGLPAMPEPVAQVLRRCFRRNPAERWNSAGEVAEVLRQIYKREVGKPYDRPTPVKFSAGQEEPQTLSGERWIDPTGPDGWNWEAGCAEAQYLATQPYRKRDPAEGMKVTIGLPRTGLPKADAVADLACYEGVRRTFRRLIAAACDNLEPRLAALCADKALIHEFLGDFSGALLCYGEAMDSFARMGWESFDREKLSGDMLSVEWRQALVYNRIGQHAKAVELCDGVINIYSDWIRQPGWRGYAYHLVNVALTKSEALEGQKNPTEARRLLDRIAQECEESIGQGAEELAADPHLAESLRGNLARLHSIRADKAEEAGDRRAAMALYDHSIDLWDELAGDLHSAAACVRGTLVRICKAAHLEKEADARLNARDVAGELSLIEQAIQTLAAASFSGTTVNYEECLAAKYMRKVEALGRRDALRVRRIGKAYRAGFLTVPVVGILAWALGTTILTATLLAVVGLIATLVAGTATVIMRLAGLRQGLEALDRAIAIRQRLVCNGVPQLEGDLAWAMTLRAATLLDLRDHDSARAAAQAALPMLRRAVAASRSDLQSQLEWANAALRPLS